MEKDKKDINDRYWNAKNEEQIRTEYKKFLAEKKYETSPDSAQLFAMEKIKSNGGYNYMGRKERELILLLAGELPPFYD